MKKTLIFFIVFYFYCNHACAESQDSLKTKNEILIIQDEQIDFNNSILYPFPHFYPIFDNNLNNSIDIIQAVESITGVLNRTFVNLIKFYDLKKIKNLTPYFPTSFITTGSAIANPKNTKRYLTPKEIKKITIYDNSAFIFFLTGKESESTKTLLSFIKNKGNTILEGNINFDTKYKYPLICVIMTLEAENMYLAKDDSICSNMFISMKEASKSVYDHQSPTIRNQTQNSILNKIKSYNLDPEENTYALTIPIKTLFLNQKKNKESFVTILKPDQYSKKLSEELEISLEK